MKNEETDLKLELAADGELMQRVVAGDERAFESLTERFRPLIYATVFKVVNDVEDAKDLTQEIQVTIWKKAAVWNPSKGRLVTWICTIARNRAIDRLRGNGRRWAMVERARGHERVEGEMHAELSGRERLADAEICSAVRKVVVELSAEQRMAIEMAFFQGMTQAEVAAKTGVPLGTTKARIRRGVQRLRTIVEDRFESDFDFQERGC